jgi:MYXO-CTERM domain-containing protein
MADTDSKQVRSPTHRGHWTLGLINLVALLGFSHPAQAQSIGATFGFNYGNDMAGPDDSAGTGSSAILNVPLYNPDPNNTNASWDTWVREAGQAGLDFLCPNLRGASPIASWSPAGMAPILTALNDSGFANQIKICAFDDNASSWQAQWSNAHNNSSAAFDIGDSANWTYIYDTNYKIFYQTIPDANRFKIDGRPVIIIWTGNPATVSNEQGNYSAAMTYVRQKCQADFGFNPFIIVNEDALQNDTTLAAVVDGAHSWNSQTGGWSLEALHNVKIGVAEAGLRAPGGSGFEDPNHGMLFQTNLNNTVGAGAVLTLIEGFMDWEENASLFRVRDLDPSGNALGYSGTLYDYPNQRLDIIRKNCQNPFPGDLLFEAEGADNYGGAAGGNGKTNFYRNGNIAIEATSDTGGGFDVGWMQPGEWLEWEQVPLNSTPHFLVRIATSVAGSTAHLVIDGASEASQMLPNTGGLQNWTTFDLGGYGTYTNSYHTIRLVFDNGGVNFNWWQLVVGTASDGGTDSGGTSSSGSSSSSSGSASSSSSSGSASSGSSGGSGSTPTSGDAGSAAGAADSDAGTSATAPVGATSGCNCDAAGGDSAPRTWLAAFVLFAFARRRRAARATAASS